MPQKPTSGMTVASGLDSLSSTRVGDTALADEKFASCPYSVPDGLSFFTALSVYATSEAVSGVPSLHFMSPRIS